MWLNEYLQALTLPKEPQATYRLLCSPKIFYTAYSISIYHDALGRQGWHKVFTSKCCLFFEVCFVFFLLVCLFPPKAIKSHNPLLLQTDDRNEKQRQKRDLQDSTHCCGSNPRSMLMNCTCDNQHLSHAITTLTKPRSIYL